MKYSKQSVTELTVGDYIRGRPPGQMIGVNGRIVEVLPSGWMVFVPQWDSTTQMYWNDYLYTLLPECSFDHWCLTQRITDDITNLQTAWDAARQINNTEQALAVAVLEGDLSALRPLIDRLIEEGKITL